MDFRANRKYRIGILISQSGLVVRDFNMGRITSNKGVPYRKAKNANYYRAAIGKVLHFLKSQNIISALNSVKQKDAIRIYADMQGYEIEGEIRTWLIELYCKKTDAVIKSYIDSFYSTLEWKELRFKVLRHYGRYCMICGDNDNICVDHIKPRSKYPELELEFDNMQVLCGYCNLKKGNRHETDYRNIEINETHNALLR